MDPKILAEAMVNEQLRGSITGGMTSEEASAFEAYASEYNASELVLNKNS